CVQGYSAPFTF
nr:immunoglobulin light chain junction region [Macaca mulatta]